MSVSISDLLRNIKRTIGNKSCYLYGASVRDIINYETPKVFNVFIKVSPSDSVQELKEKLPQYKNVEYAFGTNFVIPDIFTVNMLYLNVDEILEGNINILSQHNGLRDFNKSSIKFTKDAAENLKPEYLLEAIRLSVQTGFHLDAKTITLIFNNTKLLSSMDKREVYKFLLESVKMRGTRKFISFMNTLGVSDELFGFKLTETSIVNHFNSLDTMEFFSVILSNVKSSDLKDTLITKCGFFERDTDPVLRLSKAINEIADESEESATKFIKTIERKRLPNAVRLLKNLGLKTLAKFVKKEKENPIVPKEICIDAKIIKVSFGIDNPETVSKLLEIAQQKIVSDPDFNTQSKILAYLNYERKKYV